MAKINYERVILKMFHAFCFFTRPLNYNSNTAALKSFAHLFQYSNPIRACRHVKIPSRNPGCIVKLSSKCIDCMHTDLRYVFCLCLYMEVS